MRAVTALARLVLATAAIGCGTDPARVSLVPVENSCGRPASPNQLSITAYAESGQTTRAVGVDQVIDIGDFPFDTRQLGVEILVGGGVAGAIGKTLPLEYGELETGTVIPIFMAPPDGRCAVGDMIDARTSPLVARAGEGALVVGGTVGGVTVQTAEYYDPRTATFTPVLLPDAFGIELDGLAGAVLATLPDGKVAITGGARGSLAVFDPGTLAFDAPVTLSPQRSHHGAVATANGLLVAGGCARETDCAASPLRSVFEYTFDGSSTTGPNLASDAVAVGGQLFDLGNAYVLAGGSGTPGEAHRFTFEDRDAIAITGLRAQIVALDGGALFAAFAADGGVQDRRSNLVSPAGAVVEVAAPIAPLIDRARMVALEDGSVVAFGGLGELARYDPTSALWDVLEEPAPPGPLAAPSVVRLADGSVLEVGRDAAGSRAAFIFRPSLVGPLSGTVTAVPTDGLGVLVPSDASTLTRSASSWELASVDDTLAARALIGGPRMRSGTLEVTATVVTGGLALIAQQTTPDRALVAHLVPGEPARLEQLGTGTVCEGELVAATGAISATLTVGDMVEVRIGDALVLACDHAATETGQWGVAASGAGARIAVAAVAVTR